MYPHRPFPPNSHLTTHHPVINFQRSSDLAVRVPMAYAIRRFCDIARPTGGPLGPKAESPKPRLKPGNLSGQSPATSGYIRQYPAIKKLKKVPDSLSQPSNSRLLAKFADQNPQHFRTDPAFGNGMANMRLKNSEFRPVAWNGQPNPDRSCKPP